MADEVGIGETVVSTPAVEGSQTDGDSKEPSSIDKAGLEVRVVAATARYRGDGDEDVEPLPAEIVDLLQTMRDKSLLDSVQEGFPLLLEKMGKPREVCIAMHRFVQEKMKAEKKLLIFGPADIYRYVEQSTVAAELLADPVEQQKFIALDTSGKISYLREKLSDPAFTQVHDGAHLLGFADVLTRRVQERMNDDKYKVEVRGNELQGPGALLATVLEVCIREGRPVVARYGDCYFQMEYKDDKKFGTFKDIVTILDRGKDPNRDYSAHQGLQQHGLRAKLQRALNALKPATVGLTVTESIPNTDPDPMAGMIEDEPDAQVDAVIGGSTDEPDVSEAQVEVVAAQLAEEVSAAYGLGEEQDSVPIKHPQLIEYIVGQFSRTGEYVKEKLSTGQRKRLEALIAKVRSLFDRRKPNEAAEKVAVPGEARLLQLLTVDAGILRDLGDKERNVTRVMARLGEIREQKGFHAQRRETRVQQRDEKIVAINTKKEVKGKELEKQSSIQANVTLLERVARDDQERIDAYWKKAQELQAGVEPYSKQLPELKGLGQMDDPYGHDETTLLNPLVELNTSIMKARERIAKKRIKLPSIKLLGVNRQGDNQLIANLDAMLVALSKMDDFKKHQNGININLQSNKRMLQESIELVSKLDSEIAPLNVQIGDLEKKIIEDGNALQQLGEEEERLKPEAIPLSADQRQFILDAIHKNFFTLHPSATEQDFENFVKDNEAGE